eukprot:Ihof_evm8s167 gene=Ihof_evmTU8s167
MFLYSMTLQRPTCIMNAVAGNFSGTKQQELLVGRGNVLELYRLDPASGKIYQLLSIQIFGVIRSMTPVRLTGSSKDYIVIGSDSGRISILEYDADRNLLEKVHEETFGKSGCRRIVPGQYLAVDPKGRAVMIASVEKQKLVYILNRDQKARLTISSPLEAHKSHAILFHVVGLDVGFENPVFACLELDYSEADEDPTQEALQEARQTLVFYQLDLGLNHVVRQHSESLDDIANLLISVPGGNDGPGGVLVCVENFILYKNLGEQSDIRVPIPRRKGETDPDAIVIIVSATTIKSKQVLFFLLQTEHGDLFNLTLVVSDDVVKDMHIQYFDTVPVASQLVMMKSGFLFCASEFGSHFLYQISNLGQDSDTVFNKDSLDDDEVPTFSPRALTNLIQFTEMENLCPVMDCKIAQLGEDSDVPQFYMTNGRGPMSSFKTLRHGLEVTEMAVSELPGNPNNIWTVKKRLHADFDAYIVVSFVNATLVLSIGDNVEEVVDSGFLATTPTLSASTLGDNALMQIYPEGIRHIRADKRVNEWKSPAKAPIGHTAVNNRQVAITLHGTEIVYFELDAAGQLNEYAERLTVDAEVCSLAIGTVPQGRQRSRYLAVGLSNNTVAIYSLDPEDCLQRLSFQALPSEPSSLCLAEMDEGVDGGDQTTQFLTIGLANGVMLRTVVDPITGSLSDTRTRYLGSRPVKMFRINVQQKDAVLALSSRSWLQYPYQGRVLLTPLSYEPLDFASSFSSAQCPEGVVAIAGNTLRIISTEKLGVSFNQTTAKLSYTPRKFVIHPESNMMVIIQADYGVLPPTPQDGANMEVDGEDSLEFGPKRAPSGTWASQISVLDPAKNEITHTVILEDNESCTSIAIVKFHGHAQSFIVVGVAKDLELRPRGCSAAYLITYKLVDNATRLELVHRTPVDTVPGAICAYQGRALVGVGNLLRIYDLGKKKLLRKCENKTMPNHIVHLMSMGARIYAADVQESWHFLKYKADTNRLVIFADDVSPRWITTGCILDYNTVCGADKFGNIHVLRLPDNATDDIDDDPSGAKVLWSKGLMGGAPQKLEVLSEYHIGETVMSMQKITLVPGGGEGVVFTTIGGMI